MAEPDASGSQPHILDGCDPDECYKTMMTERTDLIKARREAEDNLVKTVVQLSATLIALISGFVTQSSVQIETYLLPVLVAALVLLTLSLSAGLTEHVFSSKAYLAQQKLVEDFYSKKIYDFEEPWANKWVRRCQVSSFVCFVSALVALGIFGMLQAGEKSHGKSDTAAAASSTASTPAATAATATAATSTLAVTGQFRRQNVRVCDEVGCTEYATSTTKEGRLDR